jgi:hypothetical protein
MGDLNPRVLWNKLKSSHIQFCDSYNNFNCNMQFTRDVEGEDAQVKSSVRTSFDTHRKVMCRPGHVMHPLNTVNS